MKKKTTFRIESLIAEFTKHDYLTAEQIAESLDVSIKTARSRMVELNLLISSRGAHIISKPRFGYQLQIDDVEKWTEYMNSRSLKTEIEAGTPGERTTHIALSLLTADNYIKINDFADELYVSPQIVSESLKELEAIFPFYKLKLERKPYYGLKLIGREFDKRNCIISCYLNDFRSFLNTDYDEDNTLDGKIFETVLEGLTTSRIQLTEVSLQSTAAYAYLSYLRCKSGFIIPDEDIVNESALKGRAATAAKIIFEQLFEDINPGEVYFFSVYISAMRYNDTPENRRNIVITPRIDTLVTRIFETVRNVFGVDFSNNLRMRMMLAQHLLSLDLRIRYHIPLLNDVYLDIRKNYPYAYSIANEAISVLVREYGTDVSSSENDWLALIFATGLYDIKTEHKLNVLVVCQLGVASSQLLKHDIQKYYSEYVNSVEMCLAKEFNDYDLSNIDYIFSTVNVNRRTNIPILMIDNLSLFHKDSAIENELLGHRMKAIDNFFVNELFFTDIKATSKDKILAELCRKIGMIRKLPDGFYKSLMEREHLHSTDYTELVAIPHPANLIPDEDIVAVVILDKPVFWGRYEVQILLLTALSLKNQEATQLFYQVTTHLISNKKMISQLLKSPTFETLISLLSTIEIG